MLLLYVIKNPINLCFYFGNLKKSYQLTSSIQCSLLLFLLVRVSDINNYKNNYSSISHNFRIELFLPSLKICSND